MVEGLTRHARSGRARMRAGDEVRPPSWGHHAAGEQTGLLPPEPSQGPEIEGSGHQTPLRLDSLQSPQQEPPCPLLLLDDAKDRLNQFLPTTIQVLRLVGRHPDSMSAQDGFSGTDPERATLPPVGGTAPKGWTDPADCSLAAVHPLLILF